MEQRRVHNNNWNKLPALRILELIRQFIEPVFVKPTDRIISDLKHQGSATLEVLEDRSHSTVYRIRETGVVYHLYQDGQLHIHQHYDDYKESHHEDALVNIFEAKEVVYRITYKGEQPLLERLKKPRFKSTFFIVDGVITLQDVEWFEQADGETQRNAALKKGIMFLKFNMRRQ
jgi:hypothetical protein